MCMPALLFDGVPRSSSIVSHPLPFTFSRSNFSFVHINLVLRLLLLTLSSDIQVLILKLSSLCFPACLVQCCRLSTSCLKDVYPHKFPAFLNQHPSVPTSLHYLCSSTTVVKFANCCFLLVILIGGRYFQQHPQAGRPLSCMIKALSVTSSRLVVASLWQGAICQRHIIVMKNNPLF